MRHRSAGVRTGGPPPTAGESFEVGAGIGPQFPAPPAGPAPPPALPRPGIERLLPQPLARVPPRSVRDILEGADPGLAESGRVAEPRLAPRLATRRFARLATWATRRLSQPCSGLQAAPGSPTKPPPAVEAGPGRTLCRESFRLVRGLGPPRPRRSLPASCCQRSATGPSGRLHRFRTGRRSAAVTEGPGGAHGLATHAPAAVGRSYQADRAECGRGVPGGPTDRFPQFPPTRPT